MSIGKYYNNKKEKALGFLLFIIGNIEFFKLKDL